MSHGGDFGEVFSEDRYYTQMNMIAEGASDGGKASGIACGLESGTGIRIFEGEASLYFYADGADEAALFRLLKDGWKPGRKAAAGTTAGFSATAGNCGISGSSVPGGGFRAGSCGGAVGLCFGSSDAGDFCGGAAARGVTAYGYTGAACDAARICGATLSEKAALLRRCNLAGFCADEHTCRMRSRYVDMDQSVFIANTEGLAATDRRLKTRLHITASAKDGDETQSSYTGPGAMDDFSFYEKIDPEAVAAQTAKRAAGLLHAVCCPTGRMPVVIANGFGGLFFHEACGHSLEASAVCGGASEFAGRIGQQVAAEKVSLIDDGSLPYEWGSLGIDDEGRPTQKNVLIENGILKGFLVDRWNGKKLDMEATGSARRQSYRFAPTSRMTNTYISPGTDSLEQMIASVDHGIYVRAINAGSVNPPTGEFNFNTSETFLIEHGEITKPVHSATLIGTGGGILRRVEMVGSDYALGQGFCYAGSGAIFIGAGQPSVKISEMTVGGDEA